MDKAYYIQLKRNDFGKKFQILFHTAIKCLHVLNQIVRFHASNCVDHELFIPSLKHNNSNMQLKASMKKEFL